MKQNATKMRQNENIATGCDDGHLHLWCYYQIHNTPIKKSSFLLKKITLGISNNYNKSDIYLNNCLARYGWKSHSLVALYKSHIIVTILTNNNNKSWQKSNEPSTSNITKMGGKKHCFYDQMNWKKCLHIRLQFLHKINTKTSLNIKTSLIKQWDFYLICL